VIDAAALLADCKVLVRNLVDDLRRLTASDPETARVVDGEYASAKAAGRTGLAKAEWAEGLYAQVAVAWVLGCVFVRFCEDNGLVPDPARPGQHRARTARGPGPSRGAPYRAAARPWPFIKTSTSPPFLPCARDSLAASTKRRTETGRLPEVPKAAIGVDRQPWVP
jgi:hypothetical protein